MAKGQITIVGMDAIGIALTLAIKQARPDAFVVAVDTDSRRLSNALKFGAVDRNDSNLAASCREASLLILNVPPSQLRETLRQIGSQLREGVVVLDLAPVKVEVLNWVAELLPDHVRHLGCHFVLHPDVAEPIAPKAELFHGAMFCMTPTVHTDEVAIKSGSDLARTIGARPYIMDVYEHDGLLAAVEGMPGLVSAALLLTATRSTAWYELSQVAGSIFARATQPAMHPAIDAGAALTLNKLEVLRWLDAFLQSLKEVREAVNDGDDATLNRLLTEAAQQREAWLADKPIAAWKDEDAVPGPPTELKRLDPLMPGWGRK
jgi:prephenate dehydrogenase